MATIMTYGYETSLQFKIAREQDINTKRISIAVYVVEQTDVSFSCVCPVINHEFRHDIVKVAVDPRGDSREWIRRPL